MAHGIALRGLTVGDTLTLIDGERMVAYPLSDDGERSFVDVSAIPFNAIESVEVLKDGASALYGADAIAGVVNIKLKQTYVGAEFTGEYGATQHHDGAPGMGPQSSAGAISTTTATTSMWRSTFIVSELIWGTSRSGLWTNLNWSIFPGGVEHHPGAIGCQGLALTDSATGYLLNPTTPNAAGVYPNHLPAEAFLPGCTAASQAGGSVHVQLPRPDSAADRADELPDQDDESARR